MVEIYNNHNEKICESPDISNAKQDVMRFIYDNYKYGAYPKSCELKQLNKNYYKFYIEVGYMVNYNQIHPSKFEFIFRVN